MYLLAALFVFLLILPLGFGQYQLSFDTRSSPPLSIPVDPKDYIYSVPLHQMVSKPVIVYIQFENGSRVSYGPLSSGIYEVATVDVNTFYSTNYNDTWAIKGRLCQKAVWWLDYPNRLNRKLQKVRCGSDLSLTTILVQAFSGRLIIDWIYHEHNIVPPNKRMLRVKYSLKSLLAYSNPFIITAPAHHLTITQQPPLIVTANHDFTVIAEIRYENDSIVDSSLDSVLHVELTIPYYYKTFDNTVSQRMLLKTSKYRLSGKDIILRQGNYDWVIRKQAVRGRVIFESVRILDPGKEIQLNLTMTMIRDPWLRVPNCKVCYSDVNLITRSFDGTDVSFREPDIPLLKTLQPITLTRKFEVKYQKLYKLRFTNRSMEILQTLKDPKTNLISITRNALIPGQISIDATDATGERIYAGPESKFKLAYKTTPASVCISSDATTDIEGGHAILFFSFCQIINKVTLELIPNLQANASIRTPSFNVEGFLNIAHIGNFGYSGDSAQLESHTNSFIKYAANDINKGYMLPFLSRHGFVFKVITYETKSKMYDAYIALLKINQRLLTKDRIDLIISSTNEQITKLFNPKLCHLDAPFISTGNADPAFSDKKKYGFFNRVCWSEHNILKSVCQACRERMWKTLLIVREKSLILDDLVYHLCNNEGIDIRATIEIDTGSVIKGETSYFADEMARIKSFDYKVIFLIASHKYQPYILRAAQLAHIDSLHGYQWILYSTYAWQFPFANEAVCQIGIPCTKAFKSTYLFSDTYNISGYHTKDWIRVLGYHFSVDRFNYKGGRVKYRPPEVGAKMALGYDALLLYASAVQKIVSMKETLKSSRLATLSRNMQVNGLTGNFQLDSNGDRIGYFGFLAQVNPFNENQSEAQISMMVTFTRLLKSGDDGSQLEIPYMGVRPDTDPQNPESKAVLPKSSKYNIRMYQSVSGVVSQYTQTVSLNPSEPWPSITYIRKENIIPSYFCQQDCGRNLLSVSDVNVYDSGRCDIQARCICNPGFHGNFCQIIVCKCKYGRCISASYCECFPGWMGFECILPICKECKHGTCVKPDKCKCNSHIYFGKSCSYHLALLLLPLLAGGLFLVGCISLLARYLLKQAWRNAALANTEWIINWEEVTPLNMDEPIMKSESNSELSLYISKYINTFLWKNEKWYGTPVNSLTIDSKIPGLRIEMVELVKLNHRNLIKYGGASLISPNIYLFQEVADKGSLRDVLINESIDLGWEFKYSFMRDICAGMRYLHEKTSFISHGRLTSYNCLIDSRWTIRISGFGAYMIRFGRFREPSEENEDTKNLFWTAPELLKNATCLDDVKNGTVAGDVFSFAVIAAEILTRSEPYEYEMSYVSEELIIDMVCNGDKKDRNPSRKIWEGISGADMLNCRPIIRTEFLPQSNHEKKQLLKMIDEAWLENPAGRPSFEKLGQIMIHIHPIKGELIDNLISLLEMYSTNLEMIVIERTTELEVSKARAEQLLGQMLPPKVAIQMKNGLNVLPECFRSATVFFSDIVDFRMICQESSPLQIVDFLNETYNAFDEVLNFYDVYKVETISDSYMVVSGIPEKNGIKHAGEIATMALHLMSTVTTFQIPHKPKSTLQLRIGIHTGPVVSGVVGMLMPRYCLFGGTVNIASRMETSSNALCIHASESTVKLLDEIGGFELESRGQIEVKGMGLMTTYWIWGKDDFEKPMPDRELAISISQHTFK